MTPEQIEELGPAFANYLEQFLFCCDYTQTFDLLGVYCRGLLSDLKRKTCAPIALAAGVAVRTLQEFLKDHHWSFAQARDTLQRHVAAVLPAQPDQGLGTVGLVDETGIKKKGTKTPGVQRQYCGELGKKENCLVTVHLGVTRGCYKTLVDADLYLPQSWDDDRDRCVEAGIPDAVVYHPKWQLALGQIDRALAQGIVLDWLTFDEGYGDKPGFLGGLDDRRLRYVGEVPRSLACFATVPRAGESSHRADNLVRHSPPGGPDLGGEGSPGVAVLGRPADAAHVLADLGPERADGGGEVLRLQRATASVAGAAAAGRLHALACGARPPAEQRRDRSASLRGTPLRGPDAALGPVLSDADLRGGRDQPVAGGKIRR